MKKSKWAILGLTTMMLLSGCGGQNQATTTNAGGEEKKQQVSGKLSFYTSQPDEDAAKLIKAFNNKYPDVQVDTFRSGTEEVVSKIQTEKQAGKVQADVLLVADSVTFEGLKKQNLLQSYKSPEESQIPGAFVDPDGMYTGTKVMATILAINTQKVKSLPTSWKVLEDQYTKGQSIMPSPLYSGAAAYNVGVFSHFKDFGWDYIKGLKANDMMVTKGNGAVLKSVASGEKPYGMIVDFMASRAKAEGSPVDLVYPTEGVPVITEPIGIMKDAKNEAAAEAFVDFVLSEEGQKVAAKIGYTPIRKGVAPPAGLKPIDQIRLMDGKIEDLYKSREEDKREFSNVFGS
ncbi:MAG TPA: ABC transporter substrate-binding protein [Bacillota bacterium]|nr:ABC transporter substrate-binding protein [Bacillota bacterium]